MSLEIVLKTNKMAGCPIRMEYEDTSKKYIAREVRTGGIAGTFPTLAQYDTYAKGIGCETRYPPGTTLIPTGFLEFAARDPVTQAKYDAMSPTWEGVRASESAITSGAYNLDFATDAKARGQIKR